MRTIPCKRYLSGAVVFLILSTRIQAIAAPIGFSAADMGALSLSAMPNSLAASDAWDAAAGTLGTIQSIDFESSYPAGPQTSLLLAPGVTLSATMAFFTISANTSSQFVYAFNTTPGGAFYAGLSSFRAAVYTFSFDTPIQAFGLYITGRGQGPSGPQEISFNDPLPQSFPLPFANGVTGQFSGFTDQGAAISSVNILIGPSSFPNLADSFAFDDVRWVSTPEAGSLPLMVEGILVGAVYLLRRRKLVAHEIVKTLRVF